MSVEDLDDLEGPWGEGIAAFLLGFAVINNPYPPSALAHGQFIEGHDFAGKVPHFELVIPP